MVVIGDAPATSRAARRSALRTLAVATAPGYDLGTLAEPWDVLDELPPPDGLTELRGGLVVTAKLTA